MSVRIVGYDIVSLDTERGPNVYRFNGVVHLETDREPVDMPFEGTKLEEQLGFNEFYFKEPDEVRVEQVFEKVSEIRDRLTEQMLAKGLSTGEFEVNIEVK